MYFYFDKSKIQIIRDFILMLKEKSENSLRENL